jgi:hypothetical protein
MAANLTTTTERALSLLGSGVGPEQTALALGVSPSYISQLLSDEQFSIKVAELRFNNLAAHSARDSSYDQLEEQLIDKIKDLLPLMIRPMEVLKAIQVINAAKRRGQSAPESIINQQNIVQISMPTTIINNFTVNKENQAVQTGNQELVTIQSGVLLKGMQNDAEPKRTESSGTNTAKIPISTETVTRRQEASRLPAALCFTPVGS